MNRQLQDRGNSENMSLSLLQCAVDVVELTALTNRAGDEQKGGVYGRER
jgi:hypothetical protein